MYICGYDEPVKEGKPNWLELFRNEFQDKFTVFTLTTDFSKVAENGTSVASSLDQYTPSEMSEFQRDMKLIENSDLVFADITSFSIKKALFLIHSHMIRKPIIIFSDTEITAKEIEGVTLISDAVFQSYDNIYRYLHDMQSLPMLKRSIFQETTLKSLQEEIQELFSREDRKDALFRSAILTTQVGQILHYLTHDRNLNPGARYIGSKADEEAQLGDGLVQYIIYCISRGFDVERVYSIGLQRMEEAVWRDTQPIIAPRQLRPNEIGFGISASRGEITGKVVVVNNLADVEKISRGKCIVATPSYEKEIWEEITARIENVIGLISGTGTPNIHPAIICRELKKPCIVGARDLVEKLRDDEEIKMTVGIEIDENSVERVVK